jgi:hypothetical protein
MVLENPALSLSVRVQDILSILESILKERNWKEFELANLKLVYTPFYFFNYDIIIEDDKGSQGTSGMMALNAVNGKLDSSLLSIIEKQPVSYEREISHDIQYEIEPVAITKDEVKEAGRVKIAGQLGIKKDNVAVSGVRMVYWPIWRIYVEIAGMVQKVEVEGVNGYPLNIEEVPEKEKGWLEVTADTLEKMKSPSGWAQLGGAFTSVAGSKLKGGASTAASEVISASPVHHTIKWFTTTKMGIYSIILLLILLLLLFATDKIKIPGVT